MRNRCKHLKNGIRIMVSAEIEEEALGAKNCISGGVYRLGVVQLFTFRGFRSKDDDSSDNDCCAKEYGMSKKHAFFVRSVFIGPQHPDWQKRDRVRLA